jgi:hypothetical protein
VKRYLQSQFDEPIDIDLSFLIPLSPCDDSTSESILNDLERTAIDCNGMSFSHDLHSVMQGDRAALADADENHPENITHGDDTSPLRKRRDCGGNGFSNEENATGAAEIVVPSEVTPGRMAMSRVCDPLYGGNHVLSEIAGHDSDLAMPTKKVATKSLGEWSFNPRKRKRYAHCQYHHSTAIIISPPWHHSTTQNIITRSPHISNLFRVYISLTGKKLTGPEAMAQCRRDKSSRGHPSRVARTLLAEVRSTPPAPHPHHLTSTAVLLCCQTVRCFPSLLSVHDPGDIRNTKR